MESSQSTDGTTHEPQAQLSHGTGSFFNYMPWSRLESERKTRKKVRNTVKYHITDHTNITNITNPNHLRGGDYMGLIGRTS